MWAVTDCNNIESDGEHHSIFTSEGARCKLVHDQHTENKLSSLGFTFPILHLEQH